MTGSKVKWSVIIPTKGRADRLLMTLSCLAQSIKQYGVLTQIIIADNNDKKGLKKELIAFCSNKKFIQLTYCHLPHANQSEMRNFCLGRVFKNNQRVMLLDSDIYMSRYCISKIEAKFKSNAALQALAPPLIRYIGGKKETCRKRSMDLVNKGGTDFNMPDQHNYNYAQFTDDVLYTNMLRGVYVLNKFSLLRVFGKHPWSHLFKVWQNVHFFLTLREMKVAFGYLLDREILALHDERPHPDTIKEGMADWNAETIKSLILLFYRNELWRPKQQRLNTRFISAISPILAFHTGSEEHAALTCILKVARILSSPKSGIQKKLLQIMNKEKSERIKRAIVLLLSADIKDVRKIKSKDVHCVM